MIDEIRVQERRDKRGIITKEQLPVGPTVADLFELALDNANGAEDRHRCKFLTRILTNFLKLVPEDLAVRDLKKSHFLAYYKWRKPQKGKASKKTLLLGSIYKELYGIRGTFSKADEYFENLEGWQPPPLPKLDEKQKKLSLHQSRRTRIVAKESELDKILARLREPRGWRQTDVHHAHRVRLAHNLEFRFETGLRRKEVAKLTRLNYFPDENALRNVVRWKTGTVTPFFPLTRRASEIIEERLALAPDSAFIFTPDGKPIEADYRTLKQVCEEIGIAYGRFKDGGFIPHDLRRSFATAIIEHTDIETARELLGHSNIEQTGDYLKTDETRLRSAMRAADGFEMKKEAIKIYKAVRRGKMNARKFIETIKNLG